MNTGIEITPQNRDSTSTKIWICTLERLRQLSEDSGRPMVEVLDLAIAQVNVASQKRETK